MAYQEQHIYFMYYFRVIDFTVNSKINDQWSHPIDVIIDEYNNIIGFVIIVITSNWKKNITGLKIILTFCIQSTNVMT